MATKRQLKEYSSIALRPEDIDGKISFFDVFGRKNAVHIEIGSGKGTFLVNQAKVFPQINFLGIEWANKYYKYAVDRIGRKALGNVRIIRTEAASFIAEHISSRTISCFHIYFPDPWPKKRHHKRSFICTENIAQLVRCLKKNGLINISHRPRRVFQVDAECF